MSHYRMDAGAATPESLPIKGDPPTPLSIDAKIGDQAVFVGNAGWDGESEHASKFFVSGRAYTVSGVEIHSYHTKVELGCLPGHWFNSVLFVNNGIVERSEQ